MSSFPLKLPPPGRAGNYVIICTDLVCEVFSFTLTFPAWLRTRYEISLA